MRVTSLIELYKRPDLTTRKIRSVVRLSLVALHLTLGVFTSLTVLWPMSLIHHSASWRIQSAIIRLWNRVLCSILGLRLTRLGAANKSTAFHVANHVSWLDIIGLLATDSGVFLAKSEVRSWPLIGWLCQRAGTLFIARGAVGAAERANKQIAFALDQGKNVYIFPEGTSTDGTKVRPFFPRLFEAAVRSGVPIQAIAIKYTRNGHNDNVAPFIDDDEFFDHLLAVVSRSHTDLTISFLPSIASDTGDRRTLAKQTRLQIEQALVESKPATGSINPQSKFNVNEARNTRFSNKLNY